MPASRTFETVRALRALAALLVILQHAFEVFSLRSGQPPVAWDAGSFGVDIFFVISGFVMVCATQGRPAGPTGAWQFLHRRLLRIVPPYWFWTLAKIGSVLAVPSLALQTKLSWGFVAASFAFIPWNHDNKPVLPVGWTLTHEMTFYLLFTAVLWLRLPLLKSLTPIFAAVAVLGLFRDPAVGPAWWTIANPIIIEFLFGVAIGKLVLSGWTLRPWVASLLLLPFIGVMTLWIGTSAELRWLDWGVPAASLVLGLALLEPVLAPRLPRLPLLLGDASYSIYLTHGFVMPVLGIVGVRLIGRIPMPETATALAAIVVASAFGVACFYFVEKPLIRGTALAFGALSERLGGRAPRRQSIPSISGGAGGSAEQVLQR